MGEACYFAPCPLPLSVLPDTKELFSSFTSQRLIQKTPFPIPDVPCLAPLLTPTLAHRHVLIRGGVHTAAGLPPGIPLFTFLVPSTAFLVRDIAFLVTGTAFLVTSTAFLVQSKAFLVQGKAFLLQGKALLVQGEAFLVPGTTFLIPGTAFLV